MGSELKSTTNLRYLALGDSYTIGEAVTKDERWPYQLLARIHATNDKVTISEPITVATTGWTTGELNAGIDARIEELPEKHFHVVSLLIGVNNQYRGVGRGYTLEKYAQEFEALLDRAIQFSVASSEADAGKHVFVVSVPDYGVTPFAARADGEKIYKGILEYNAIAQEICQKKGVSYINITEISRRAKDDKTLNASDGLHPSGEMYRLWVDEAIFPIVSELISKLQ
jgi:lysophospholipase L1-like esterase